MALSPRFKAAAPRPRQWAARFIKPLPVAAPGPLCKPQASGAVPGPQFSSPTCLSHKPLRQPPSLLPSHLSSSLLPLPPYHD